MDGRHGPVCHSIRPAFSGISAMMRTTDITARSMMIAWPAPSPSSPAPSARRYAALGLDCSPRPSKVADRAADASCPTYGKRKSTFTEISYTKLLTIPSLLTSSSPSCSRSASAVRRYQSSAIYNSLDGSQSRAITSTAAIFAHAMRSFPIGRSRSHRS
jgi:hypothetical protein